MYVDSAVPWSNVVHSKYEGVGEGSRPTWPPAWSQQRRRRRRFRPNKKLRCYAVAHRWQRLMILAAAAVGRYGRWVLSFHPECSQ